MSDVTQGKLKAAWAGVLAPLMIVLGLTGCLSSGGSSETTAVVVAAGPAAPAAPVTFPITAIAAGVPGQVTVTSANTLAPGDIIVISGTTSYNGTFTVVSATATSFTVTAPFVANEAAGAWTAGGGVIAGCPAGVGITLPAMNTVASRFTGVAPLSIFFDATATTGVVAQPFHELLYTWNFGDPAGGANWAYGTGSNNSKNAATGPVAAHVFETPGTYTVTLTVTDGVNTVSNNCMQIAVQDPDIVFAGTATRCYSKVGNFAGCPAGATQITDAAGVFSSAVTTDLAAGRRLLFRAGETWVNNGQAVLNVDGPWTIGSYPLGGGRVTVEWAAGNSMLRFGGNGSNSFKDARVMDLQIDGTDPSALVQVVTGVDHSGTFNQITFLRFDCTGVNNCFTQDAGKPNLAAPWDQFTVVDSTLRPTQGGGGGNGMFLFSSRTAVLGNLFDNNLTGEHNFRSMYWNKLVLSSNTFQNPNATKANVTLRGPDWNLPFGPLPAGTYSIYGIVSDNKFVGAPGVSNPVNTSVGSGFALASRNRFVIFERNWWTNQPAATSLLALNSSFATIRNNIFDLSATTGGQCMDIGNNGDTPNNGLATDNWVYNNTCYANQGAAANVFGFALFGGATNTTLKNNLMYSPSALSTTVIRDLLGVATVGASGTFGNSSDVQGQTNPNFDSALPTVPTNFGISNPLSYARSTGVAVPVWTDFFGVSNAAPWDRGAIHR
ncbi:PKD domain-containing protein [Sulfuritalea sp.]|jgi:hypothetical protein|uniref:PKD domain-containing protein n=1 Tax=Sulfuritalea sp. TaxID=2480090 RepID=UPI001ACD14CC|nr:PKD domain-containing protein [Sulfuritalea sp.]MBN8474901.1 PKD domain-containing protein [Sulfuritalea sp.]